MTVSRPAEGTHPASQSTSRLVCVSSFPPLPMKTRVRPQKKTKIDFYHIECVAGQLTKSQYPVFTIYVQKNCLPSAASCDAAWSFERVMDHELDTEVRQLSRIFSIDLS